MIKGLALSFEDIKRLAAATGMASIACLKDANGKDDVREGLALGVLHMKLVNAICEAEKELFASGDNNSEETKDDYDN